MIDYDDDIIPGAMGASDTITINSTAIPSLTSADIASLSSTNLNSVYYSNSASGGTYTMPQYGNITIGTSSGSNGMWGSYSTNTSPLTVNQGKNAITVSGDAEFEGDIKWKGRSLGKMLEAIEDRLAILTPDPKKLEKYEALKKAYNHYKLMEKLIGED
jgi:hypothetical protein